MYTDEPYREYAIQSLLEEVTARDNVIRSLEQVMQTYRQESREHSLLFGYYVKFRHDRDKTIRKLRRYRGY
jgi:hypothetical protein